MAVTSSQLYLAMITLLSMHELPAPSFGFAVITEQPMWGNVFSFVSSAKQAVVLNALVLSLYALWKDTPASRFLNLHVVLFLASYGVLLLLNFMFWESDRISITQSLSTPLLQAGVSPPDSLVTIVAIPVVLFNLVLLPLSFFIQPSGCRGIDITVAA